MKRGGFDRNDGLLACVRDINTNLHTTPLSCSQLQAIYTLSLLPPSPHHLYHDGGDGGGEKNEDGGKYNGDQKEDKKEYNKEVECGWKGGLWESEVVGVDEGVFADVGDDRRAVMDRCMLVSALLRNMSFIADKEVVSHCGVVMLLSRLLLFRHRHKKLCGGGSGGVSVGGGDGSGGGSEEWQEGAWWWPVVESVREDAMVAVANVAGCMDLSAYPDEVLKPLLDALLHWLVCPNEDPPNHQQINQQNNNNQNNNNQNNNNQNSNSTSLSFQRLALEALLKLCVLDNNVDLIFAMPPFARIFSVMSTLVTLFNNKQPLVVREMSIGLLSRLLPCNACVGAVLALHRPFIPSLLDFLEACLDGRLTSSTTSHHHSLHPYSASTSIDVLNRVATTLRSVSDHSVNKCLISNHQQRLLIIATHPNTPPSVATTLCHVLANCP